MIIKKSFFSLILLVALSIKLYSQTLFLKVEDEWYGYVDSSGNVIIPIQYSFAFTDTLTTLAFVADKGGIIAINKENQKLFTVLNYDNGPDYVSEGLFRIVDDKTGYIGFANMEGNIIIPPVHFFATPFNSGLAAFNEGGTIEREDYDNHWWIEGGKWGFINNKGEVVFPPVFDKVSGFEENEAEVTIGTEKFRLYHTQ